MRGAGLRRYIPDPQSGAGFTREVVRDVLAATAKGIKSGGKNPKAAIRSGYRAGRMAVKRKAEQYMERKAKKALKDIFG